MREEIIGRARLILGDCRDVLPSLSADAMITSPPYNCGKDYGTYDDAREMADFVAFLRDTVFAGDVRVRVINVGQYIGSRASRVLFRDVLTEASGLKPIDEVIWDKGPANGAAWGNYPDSPRIRAQHESLFVYGSAKMPNGNGLDWQQWSRLTTSMWRISSNVDLALHPAMMPVAVAARAIMLWTDKAGTVIDPFMGSGTTGVASVQHNRDFIGIELDEKHFDTACRRIEEAQRQGDLFIDGGDK